MPTTVISPNRNFALLDPSTFGRASDVEVNAILTFDDGPQDHFDTTVRIDALATDLEEVEVDFIGQILEASDRSLDDLVKVSVCFMVDGEQMRLDPPLEAIVDHLCRFRAKWYFQPNQRDPHEQAIVDAFRIASLTAPIGQVAA